MKRPNGSSPTTPTSRDPEAEPRGAAGGDRRRAADRQPDALDDPLGLAEDRDRIRVGDDDVRVDLADDEQVDVALAAGVAGISTRSYQPSPGASGVAARPPSAARHGAADVVDERRRAARGARGPSSPGRRRAPPASSVAASAQTERPTSTPLAPAPQATATWRSNVASSTPPGQQDPGQRRRGVELGAGLRASGLGR